MKYFIIALMLCLPIFGQAKYKEIGVASFYTVRTNGGTITASGKPLSDHKATAAHRRLPFGSVVKVTDLKTKKSVVVTITDNGPFIKNRIIDLSKKAAQTLSLEKRGISKVQVELVSLGKGKWRR